MKVLGVEVESGYLLFKDAQSVPAALWNRVKHAAAKAGLADELRADYVRERDAVFAAPPVGLFNLACQREQALFRCWVRRLFGEVERWPWEGGWTPEALDAYLAAPARRAA